MATANVTVTAKTGPAVQNTTKVYNGVKKINIDLTAGTFSLTLSTGQILDFDYTGIATVTYTISGTVATVAFS